MEDKENEGCDDAEARDGECAESGAERACGIGDG